MVRLAALTLGILAALTSTPFAQRSQTTAAADATRQIVAAAQAVVATLDESKKARVQFPFDSPQKTRWSNLPSPMYARDGIRLADLTQPQRDAVMKLMSVALSREGYQKALDIMKGDEVLRTQSGGNAGRGGRGPSFGELEYYLAFVGAPSTTTPWTLMFGGHHLGINLTMAGPQATLAPSLPAAQPATFTIEGRTVRPLGDENDKAFVLINALDDKQRAQAIIGSKVADLVLGPTQNGRTIAPEGIRVSTLSAQQQMMVWEIVREWVGISHDAFAEPRMTEIRSHLNDTYFAWSGPITKGSAAYFRVQGPTLHIEYAPQGNVDHIHTIYRDPTNDYGSAIAKK
ncbi:MAG: DUF3500 domain-containing protein [Cyanobacteria bacterium]|nr:DUF3500 domain-containing protein [Cyanobacteriota bacterium]